MKSEKSVLLTEKERRLQYSAIYASLVEWLNTAESSIEEDHSGVDYEVVDQQLTLHKVRFVLHYLCVQRTMVAQL